MIVVVVRNEHDINWRQLGQQEGGVKEALRAGPRNWRGSLVPHGVYEHAQAVNFNEHGGMAYPGDAQTAGRLVFVNTWISAKRAELDARDGFFFIGEIKLQQFGHLAETNHGGIHGILKFTANFFRRSKYRHAHWMRQRGERADGFTETACAEKRTDKGVG